jgi:CP family cyanate transporter-like MFS transporter
VIPLATIPAGLLLPALSDGRDRRPWVFVSAAVMTVAMLGIAFAPDAAAWVWITLFGLSNGGVFSLALTLPLDIARSPSEVTWMTSWMLGIGFLMSGASTVIVGALRDLTGGFTVPIALIGILGFAAGIVAMRLRPPAPA